MGNDLPIIGLVLFRVGYIFSCATHRKLGTLRFATSYTPGMPWCGVWSRWAAGDCVTVCDNQLVNNVETAGHTKLFVTPHSVTLSHSLLQWCFSQSVPNRAATTGHSPVFTIYISCLVFPISAQQSVISNSVLRDSCCQWILKSDPPPARHTTDGAS